MAERRIVVVEGAFTLRGKGALIEPRLTVKEAVRGAFPVRLRLPSGEDVRTTASLEVAHVQGPGGTMFAMLRLTDLNPGEVPIGTEIWTTE